MSYGILSDEQKRYLRTLVKGKVVADLGCGLGHQSRNMARWGAAMVHGVDKEAHADIYRASARLQWHRSYFAFWKVPEGIEVALLCWPQNTPLQGILPILAGIPTVVYIGKNTDGTVCGNPGLFQHLATREVVGHIPDKLNTLIHYGPNPRVGSKVYHEEFAGLFPQDDWLPFDPSKESMTPQEWEIMYPLA